MNPFTASALVAAGGAVGALMRFWLAVLMAEFAASHLIVATFIANVTGSFLIGVAAEILAPSAILKVLLMTGVLGGFTTFSTFSLETVRLLEEGRLVAGFGNVVLSVGACLMAASSGLYLARAAS